MLTRLGAYARLLRLHRPIGTILLLWPALWALWAAAGGMPPPWILAVFCLGALLMRSAGCAFNDYVDRDIDAKVERTRTRPLPAGELRPMEALLAAAALVALAFALALSLGPSFVLMAVVGLALATIYPFCKRHLPMPQVVLGLAFSWSVPMAFMAVTNTVPASAWLLFLACVSWVVAYDTIYAMADMKDDLQAGVNSSAIVFGRHAREAALGLHSLCLALLALYGASIGLHWIWYLCLAAALLLALWQWRLLRTTSISRCLRAFSMNGWLGLVVFTGLTMDTWLH